MIVVSDTTALSNLILIGHIHLLEQLFGHIVIPVAVRDELLQLKSHLDDVNIFLNASWVDVRAVQHTDDLLTIRKVLDQGEAEAIVLASENKAHLLIIDEIKGRAYAQSRGIKKIGTLGILVFAKDENLIPEVKPLIEQLLLAGFRIKESLIREVLISVLEF